MKVKIKKLLKYMSSMTKNEMADRCGIAYNTFIKVLKGESSLFTANKAAEAMNIKLTDLFFKLSDEF